MGRTLDLLGTEDSLVQYESRFLKFYLRSVDNLLKKKIEFFSLEIKKNDLASGQIIFGY